MNKLNYSIDNGITVDSASISSDGKTVSLITSQNTANQVYTVVVRDIKDLSGNIISPIKNSAQYYYIGDSTPPELVSAAILDSVTVELLFSERVDVNTAQVISNYFIDNGISVQNAYLSSNQNKVTLHTSQHISGQSYNIVVQNIIDLAGNLISNKNSARYSYYVDNTPPNISGISATNNKSVTVKFSKRLDPNSAANKNNYNISNNIRINNVKLQPDSSEVLINTSQAESGAEYTLTVTNIKDRTGNRISPNPESKNYQVPAKSSGGHGKNKLQSAASTSWYQDFSPDKCIDGEEMDNPLSRWCSNKVLPDTIEFDLGKIYSIDSLRISFYQWECGGQYKYSVYASNDLNKWEPVVEEVWSEDTEWTEIMFEAVEKRYLKLILLESNQSAPASIWEIETFGAEKISGIKTIDVTPDLYQLSQNYPNPFNPSTIIRWQSSKSGRQTIKVYDILGNEVATLIDENKPAGTYEVKFDASDLASGIYFYKLITDGYISTKKMVLLK